ncbi:helix-turn-helix domain-containing protein [Paraburkholderia sp. Tr-20389]|uniref:helix-turn-helix transcriptional regulator n=1 Tax=Paraburkholderia sp. Tr-20389 TaxID=2703903 RepID=UPI00197EFCFD|nr:helix-turn-helix domain-containing protein [Paraburkholderia sp. Tr-20389]MBN3758392.1 helix-turn-helix domain-containing protein [Paraburkholderia sp. Tr-20389]
MGNEESQQAAPFGAMTVKEFCEAMQIDRSTLWKLRQRGEAPEILFVGRKVLITYRAAEQWARAMEAKSQATGEREIA